MNIKLLTSVFLMAGIFISAADAAPSYLIRDRDVTGSYAYDVTYDYKDKPKNGLYINGRVEMNMLSWENVYTSGDVVSAGSDKYSMESMFGGSLAVGKRFNYFWRWEIEAGHIGLFEDADATTKFELSAPYAIANLMYDFNSGLYFGGGFGFAMPTTTLDGDLWIYNSNRKESTVSPMGALMFGFSSQLDYNFVLDVRYRIAGFSGTAHSMTYETTGGTFNFKNDIGMILDNSISVGLRYEF